MNGLQLDATLVSTKKRRVLETDGKCFTQNRKPRWSITEGRWAIYWVCADCNKGRATTRRLEENGDDVNDADLYDVLGYADKVSKVLMHPHWFKAPAAAAAAAGAGAAAGAAEVGSAGSDFDSGD